MDKLVLIHGTSGHGNIFWFPYVKEYFAVKGWLVDSPDMPNSSNPVKSEWFEHCNNSFEVDSETVMVGHSLGCPTILSYLQRSEVKIKKAILVAGPYDKGRSRPGYAPILDFLEKYDWEKIKQNCEQFIFVHSTNDPWDCDEHEANFAFEKLGGMKIMMENQGHFGSTAKNDPYPEFPLVLKLIEN